MIKPLLILKCQPTVITLASDRVCKDHRCRNVSHFCSLGPETSFRPARNIKRPWYVDYRNTTPSVFDSQSSFTESQH